MKKILLIFCTLLLLSGCFGSEESISEGLVEFSNDNFALSLPGTWKAIPKTDLPTPKVGEVVLAYSSLESRDDYTNNIVIIGEDNSMWENNHDLIRSLPSYFDETLQVFHRKEVSDIQFADNQSGTVLEFQGKYNNTTPLVTYLQTARSCGEKAYFLTISVAEQLESYDRYMYLLGTFECK